MSPRPAWLKVKLPGGGRYYEVRRLLGELRLPTVCNDARCPNVAECWGEGTATFMVLGRVCTRSCRFCDVQSGRPSTPPEADEPERIAEAVERIGLRYVVITSVDRDDLPDGGAAHFAAVVDAVRHRNTDVIIELLTPDFGGDASAISLVASSCAGVLGHNIETVARLSSSLRDRRCDYDRSLGVLAAYHEQAPRSLTKSSLLLGLGETRQEVHQAMQQLRHAGVDWVTLGQYLQPTRRHARVVEYVSPEAFDAYAATARDLGFPLVTAGPLVRSSYRAAESAAAALLATRRDR